MAAKDDTPVVDRNLAMTLVERLHVQKALGLYAKSIERSRSNEVPGSDIYRLRTSDLDVIRAILNRVS